MRVVVALQYPFRLFFSRRRWVSEVLLETLCAGVVASIEEELKPNRIDATKTQNTAALNADD